MTETVPSAVFEIYAKGAASAFSSAGRINGASDTSRMEPTPAEKVLNFVSPLILHPSYVAQTPVRALRLDQRPNTIGI